MTHINRTLLYIPFSLSLSFFFPILSFSFLGDAWLMNSCKRTIVTRHLLLHSFCCLLSFIKHYHPDNINLLNPLLVYNCDFLWTNCILPNLSLASSLNFTTSVIVGDMGTTSILKWSRVSHVLKWSCVSHVTLQCRLNL